MVILFIAINILTSGLNTVSVYSQNDNYILQNKYISVQISKKRYNLNAIHVCEYNLIDSDCHFNVKTDFSDITNLARTLEVADFSPDSAAIKLTEIYSHYIVKQYYQLDTLGLSWKIEYRSTSDDTSEVGFEFCLPLADNIDHLFYPAFESPQRTNKIISRELIYREHISIPFISCYHQAKNYGISINIPFEVKKPFLSFSWTKSVMKITLDHYCATKEKDIDLALYLIPHNGDWRPGLSYLIQKYPKYFNPHITNTACNEGWFYLANPHDDSSKMTSIASQSVTWIELHGYFPFYGYYAPKEKSWDIVSFSKKSVEDSSYLKNLEHTSYTYMKNLIRSWQDENIHVYLYFQCFEAWQDYAKYYFHRDIALDQNGLPLPSFRMCNLMNPQPAGMWGKYIIDQLHDLLIRYPGIDGIFFDRMDYLDYDFAHTDSTTMVNQTPVYMLGFAQEKINNIIFHMIHDDQKGVCGNNPSSIEVCKDIDAIMAEGSVRNLYKIQYLGLTRPITYLPYDRTPEETEQKLKQALVCGAFPSITLGGDACQRLDEKYLPLFELLEKRSWVLTSNPIVVPGRFKANIFQTPDTDYVAVIISPDKSQLVPHPYEYDIPIGINVLYGNEINYVYLLSGDWGGVSVLEFEKQGDEIHTSIPAHLSSSVIYLSQKEKFKNVQKTVPISISEGVSFAPVEDIFVKNDKGDIIDFYFSNNINQRIVLTIRGTSFEGDAWMQPLENIVLEAHETRILPLTIGAQHDGTIKVTAVYNNQVINKIFPFKMALIHNNNDMFYDDFSEGMEQWKTLNGIWTVTDGIVRGGGSSHFAIVARGPWPDYICEVKTRVKGSVDPAVDWLKAYLFFRVQDEENFYRFGIHGDGRVVDLYKCIGGKYTFIAASSFVPKKDTWYALRIRVEGTRIIGYIDGEKVVDAHDTEFSQGGIGIGVLEDGMICEYKDVIVKKL